MGVIVGSKGKWTIEARDESFLIIYRDGEMEGEAIESYYSDMPDFLDALTMLKDYLVNTGRLKEKILTLDEATRAFYTVVTRLSEKERLAFLDWVNNVSTFDELSKKIIVKVTEK